MSSYSFFAEYYDGLTENVNYAKRADYIMKIADYVHHDFGLTMDLACGTGSLTIELAKRGVDIFGVDGSAAMLSQAQQKSAAEGQNILFLCQKMQSVDLFGTIDTCICTLDSINHITDPNNVQKAFNKVSLFMNKGGYFIFDVNTIYKHRVVLSNNTFVYDTRNVYCVWQNALDKDKKTVRISLDFFENIDGVYARRSESFSERAYSDQELKLMLNNAGFMVEHIFGENTLAQPQENSERNIYVAKKISETGRV
ncbi:MAG TPA: class I SAM-dependent methyltransferase [Clostridiales bacterium]|nr:class I SAM-dependent methyltransferase [Clostridiales bacterium]